jgi:hypothetical protein
LRRALSLLRLLQPRRCRRRGRCRGDGQRCCRLLRCPSCHSPLRLSRCRRLRCRCGRRNPLGIPAGAHDFDRRLRQRSGALALDPCCCLSLRPQTHHRAQRNRR